MRSAAADWLIDQHGTQSPAAAEPHLAVHSGVTHDAAGADLQQQCVGQEGGDLGLVRTISLYQPAHRKPARSLPQPQAD